MKSSQYVIIGRIYLLVASDLALKYGDHESWNSFVIVGFISRMIMVVIYLVSSQKLVNNNIWFNCYYDFLIVTEKRFKMPRFYGL